MSGWTRIALGVLSVAILTLALAIWSSRPHSASTLPPSLADFGTPAHLPSARHLSLAPGKDRPLVKQSCATCHSLAPIIRHAGFTKPVWRKEVRKMIDRYGAPIDDELARRITAYLQRNYSARPAAPAGTRAAPGAR